MDQRTLLAIFDQSPLGIAVVHSESGAYRQVNRRLCEITGYSEAELLALSFQRITHPDDLQADLENMERLRRGEVPSFHMEKRYYRKDGSIVWVGLTCVRLWETGSPELEHLAMVEDITERKRADDRLAESERKYRELVEQASSIILRWDAAGRITFLNEYGQRFFGYSAGEILGRHVVGTIVPETERSGRDLRALMERICVEPEAFEQNINENQRRDGERVFVAWTNTVVRDERGEMVEIVSIGRDVTAHRQAEEALRASEARYHSTLDGILEGCQLLGFDWRYLYLNAAAAVHNRRPNEELLGRTMMEAWPGIEHTSVFAIMRRCMEERIGLQEEVDFQFPDGTRGWFDLRCQPVPEGIFLLSIDIGKRKQAQRELEQLNETLELKVAERTAELAEARDRAESADRLKSAFLATMSHELRTPLNSIIGFTGLLLRGLAGPLNPEQHKQLEMVRGSARHLLALINDVLDISKIEAGQLEVHAEPFDLLESVNRVAASVRPLAEQKGLDLRVETPAVLGPLHSDQRRVEQVMLNLLQNAIKFTEHGHVSLVVERTGEPGQVRIRVADTGIGISSEHLPSLFQPFRQIDSGTTRQHDGTGLGLAICRRLAHLLGGRIEVNSEPDVGSEFTLALPSATRGEA